MLIPLLSSASIDEVVARVRAANKAEVELLVPNNMKALQSSAGCTILKHSVADSGTKVTLFTNDDKTQRAARSAGLPVIAVDSAIASPTKPPGPSSPHHAAFTPTAQHRDGTGSSKAARVMHAPSASPDAEFLAGLEAFEQTLAPMPHGAGHEWDAGVAAVPVPEARGAASRDVGSLDPWALAPDDVGVSVAEAPRAARTRQGDAVPPRRAPTGQHSRPAESRGSRGQPPAPGAARSRFGDALTSVFPRAGRPAGGGDGNGTSSRTVPKGAAPPQRFNPWIMVMIAAVVLIAVLIYTSGLLPIGKTPATIGLSPAPVQTEQQSYNDLVLPVTETAPQEGSGQVQGAVLVQPVRASVKGQADTTTVAPIGRASGTLLLRNTLSQPVLLRAGTIVPASNGVQFTVDGDVTVPAAMATADGITFGRAEASLTANVPGASGNIGPGSITSIPGYEGTLRVEQGAFGGGSDQEVLVVRTEDVNRVLPNALSRLYGTGTQALQLAAAGRPGFALVSGTISPTLDSLKQLNGVEVAAFPPIGSVTSDGTFELDVYATFSGVAEPTDRPITSQIAMAAKNLLVSDGRASRDARVQVSQWTIGTQGLVVDAAVQPPGTAPTLSPEFAQEVQRTIAGKPRAEALEYLRSLVEQGRITGFSSLPETWETIPEGVEIVQAPQ